MINRRLNTIRAAAAKGRGDGFLPGNFGGGFQWQNLFNVGLGALTSAFGQPGKVLPFPTGSTPANFQLPGLGPAIVGGAAAAVAGKAIDMGTKFFANVTGRKKHRKMNICNQAALRRSIRRLDGFRHLAASVEKTIPHRPARKVGCRKKCS